MGQAARRRVLLLSRPLDPTLSLDSPLPNRPCLFSPYMPEEAYSSTTNAVCCDVLQMLVQSGQRRNQSYDGEQGRQVGGNTAPFGQEGAR